MNALIIVDVQNDFLPGGALAIEDGDEIIPVINKLQKYFDVVVATQDWHPGDHKSFASNHEGKKPGEVIDLNGLNQVLWPDHCVQHSDGAELAEELSTSVIEKIVYKGTNLEIDSYSGFFDNGKRQATDLEAYLRSKNVDTVYVVGLATDYCVKYTALDAAELGFKTYVIPDATEAVNLSPDDFYTALEEMENGDVTLIKSNSFLED